MELSRKVAGINTLGCEFVAGNALLGVLWVFEIRKPVSEVGGLGAGAALL